MRNPSYDEECSDNENLCKALYSIASALRDLGTGNAATPMGAIELLSFQVKESFSLLADTLSRLE